MTTATTAMIHQKIHDMTAMMVLKFGEEDAGIAILLDVRNVT